MKKSLILLTILVFTLTISTAVLAKSLQFETINFPGVWFTEARGINNRGQIAGFAIDVNWAGCSFLFDGDTFITIDFPGALFTSALGINDRGQIVGSYIDSNWDTRGFLADKVRMAPPASDSHLRVATTWARIKAR